MENSVHLLSGPLPQGPGKSQHHPALAPPHIPAQPPLVQALVPHLCCLHPHPGVLKGFRVSLGRSIHRNAAGVLLLAQWSKLTTVQCRQHQWSLTEGESCLLSLSPAPDPTGREHGDLFSLSLLLSFLPIFHSSHSFFLNTWVQLCL